LPNNIITDQNVLNAMYTDPFYGLNNFQNYARWEVLQNVNVNTTDIN
jgi:hypothetical protein